jgi:hypothetical protein
MPIVREVLSREGLPEPEAPLQRRGLAVGETTAGLLSACARLINLLETPDDIAFLSPLIQREIVYRPSELRRESGSAPSRPEAT